MKPIFSIRAVSLRTGLSSHTIRAWEKRYGVLCACRSDSNRRLYSEEEVQRLVLLRQAQAKGHRLAEIAQLDNEELRGLVGGPGLSPVSEETAFEVPPQNASQVVEACLDAIRALDADGLERTLNWAIAHYGIRSCVDCLIVKLLAAIDTGWTTGDISIAHEHLASATLRGFLDRSRRQVSALPNAPRLVVTTPAAQIHELGAMLVALVASLEGWDVTYLGPNLPAVEIATAVRICGAQTVALSIVYPANDPQLETELELLRQVLGPQIAIWIGGRSASAQKGVIQAIGARLIESFDDLRAELANRHLA